MKKKFYIVRHGQTDWNLERRRQGRTDIELNEIGRQQAMELREKIVIRFEEIEAQEEP